MLYLLLTLNTNGREQFLTAFCKNMFDWAQLRLSRGLLVLQTAKVCRSILDSSWSLLFFGRGQTRFYLHLQVLVPQLRQNVRSVNTERQVSCFCLTSLDLVCKHSRLSFDWKLRQKLRSCHMQPKSTRQWGVLPKGAFFFSLWSWTLPVLAETFLSSRLANYIAKVLKQSRSYRFFSSCKSKRGEHSTFSCSAWNISILPPIVKTSRYVYNLEVSQALFSIGCI